MNISGLDAGFARARMVFALSAAEMPVVMPSCAIENTQIIHPRGFKEIPCRGTTARGQTAHSGNTVAQNAKTETETHKQRAPLQ